MPKATEPNTTAAPADSLWTIGDVEPLLHDMEATIGIFSHVANSRNQIDPGELILIEDKFLDLHKRLAILWDKAWEEHLAFRHGESPASPPDAVWDLLRSTAKVVLAQCDHPERSPSAPAEGAAGGQDAELIGLATEHAAAIEEIRRLQAANDTPDDAFEPLDARRHAGRERATALAATTQAGLQAKARLYLTEIDLNYGTRAPDSHDTDGLDMLADSIVRDIVGTHGVPMPKAEPMPVIDRPPTISELDSLVECQAADIIANAKALGGTMNGGISTIAAGLALALEQAHPGAALMLGRQGSLVAATEPRCTVVEYLEKKLAKAATVEGQGMTNEELSDLYHHRPDASLLHMAREFAKVEAQTQILNELSDPSEAAMNAVASRQYAITDVMIGTPAKTAAGWRAKAEVLAASIRLDVTTPDSEHQLATSLAEDLMREVKAER
jgi:hypothetical protein